MRINKKIVSLISVLVILMTILSFSLIACNKTDKGRHPVDNGIIKTEDEKTQEEIEEEKWDKPYTKEEFQRAEVLCAIKTYSMITGDKEYVYEQYVGTKVVPIDYKKLSYAKIKKDLILFELEANYSEKLKVTIYEAKIVLRDSRYAEETLVNLKYELFYSEDHIVNSDGEEQVKGFHFAENTGNIVYEKENINKKDYILKLREKSLGYPEKIYFKLYFEKKYYIEKLFREYYGDYNETSNK